ncbi:hypothetical protein [Bradyrhizobium sp. NBAIM01]|uniref:hypothetical protein n=1 Tax=Bradyrhizobium sp. NBAIM01 TaxID=2793818 RepID=UPI001CD22443|nr:hypothetical protein [Bradyrhizobium sp. NBAIM01]MCA1515643.1 hypothetical protein [Bradyrhizobium sp. NBAIM01]
MGSEDDRFFALTLPEVGIVAAHKNVHLDEGAAEAVLRYALKDIPRKMLKQALQNNERACWTTSFALNHALDVLAMTRLISLSESVCKTPLLGSGPLVEKAEECLKQQFANDKAPTCAVWRDPKEDVADFVRSAFSGPTIRLPETVAVRATVQSLPANSGSGGA